MKQLSQPNLFWPLSLSLSLRFVWWLWAGFPYGTQRCDRSTGQTPDAGLHGGRRGSHHSDVAQERSAAAYGCWQSGESPVQRHAPDPQLPEEERWRCNGCWGILLRCAESLRHAGQPKGPSATCMWVTKLSKQPNNPMTFIYLNIWRATYCTRDTHSLSTLIFHWFSLSLVL